MTLDQPGYWRHNRIGWLGPSEPPTQLGELVAEVNLAIQTARVNFDARPHAPHVTLLRNTAGGEFPVCEQVNWSVRDFVLVASKTEAEGAYYEVIRRWCLG